MLIIRTPFRISLFGGGTDIPKFFCDHGGEVLGFAINKYCYVTIRDLPPFYGHKFRLSYSIIEQCKSLSEIKHPLLNVALKDFKTNNLEIHYDADLPGNSGIGSSSSFAVGLANGLFTKNKKYLSKEELSKKAIYWERYLLQEKGGYQDQIFASYGGFRNIIFNKDSSFNVNQFEINENIKEQFMKSLLLCYVPVKRLSSRYSVENHLTKKSIYKTLLSIKENVNLAKKLFKSGDIESIGELLNDTWNLKKSLPEVTNEILDNTHKKALQSGAIGGKLLGAGSGGFMLFICEEGATEYLQRALRPLVSVKIGIDHEGTNVIYND